MRSIRIVNVTKSYDGENILKDFNLTIPSGQFFVLLGPSGSGKTTLLRLIAGFESVDSGKIYLGDNDITNEPINKRKINTVFQNYALFPHLDVFDNVAYGLKVKKVPNDIIEQKVTKIIEVMRLSKHIYKPIQQLSGGQQQRVALARAIVNEPDVLLLDEPLAALDVKLRERMLMELVDLQNNFKTTFVYVTHDQNEALTVGHNIAVLNEDGEVEQFGTPKEIYEFPASSFAATFIGTTNLLKGVLEIGSEPKIIIEGLGSFSVVIDGTKKWASNGMNVFMSLRPEKIRITKKELKLNENHIQGKVASIIYQGRFTQYNVKLANNSIIQVFEQNEEHIPQEDIKLHDNVNLYWQKENAVLLEK